MSENQKQPCKNCQNFKPGGVIRLDEQQRCVECKRPWGNQKQSVEGLKEWFEANYLDGDKIQDGQMLSSQECFEALSQQQLEVVEKIKLKGIDKNYSGHFHLGYAMANTELEELKKTILQSLSTLNINK